MSNNTNADWLNPNRKVQQQNGPKISGQNPAPRGMPFRAPKTKKSVALPRMRSPPGLFDEVSRIKTIPTYPPGYTEPPPKQVKQYNFARDPIDWSRNIFFPFDTESLNVPLSTDKSKSLGHELPSNPDEFYDSLGTIKDIQKTAIRNNSVATKYPSRPPKQQSTGARTSATKDGMSQLFSGQSSIETTPPGIGTLIPPLPYNQSVSHSYECGSSDDYAQPSSASQYSPAVQRPPTICPLSPSRYYYQLPSATPPASHKSLFSPSRFYGEVPSNYSPEYDLQTDTSPGDDDQSSTSTSDSPGYDHLNVISPQPIHKPLFPSLPANK